MRQRRIVRPAGWPYVSIWTALSIGTTLLGIWWTGYLIVEHGWLYAAARMIGSAIDFGIAIAIWEIGKRGLR